MRQASIIRLAATAAIATTAAACTSTSPKAGPSTPTSPPSAVSTSTSVGSSTTTGSAPVDPHQYLLQLADLPDGLWKAQAHNADANRRANDAYYDACLGIPTIDDNESAVYYSDFARSDNQAFASSEVDVVKSAAYASRDFAALKGPKAQSCLLSSAKHDFAEQDKTATNKLAADGVSVIDAPAPYFAVRLNATVSPPTGAPEPVVIDTYFVQQGNAEVQVQFLTFSAPDSSTATSALAHLAKRLQG